MYNIAICDDNCKYLEKITKMVEEICYNQPCKIKTYEDGSQLLFDIEDKINFDIYLLDIEMSNTNGMDVARQIKTKYPDAIIIFITSYTEYVYDSFALSVFRYIPKSALGIRLEPALMDAFYFLSTLNNGFYQFNNSTSSWKIPYKDIYYIYKIQKYSIFVLKDGSEERERRSLMSVYETLTSDDFVFVERGHIANFYNVIGIENANLVMRNKDLIPVSQDKLKDVKIAFNEYWSQKL